jgi:DNA-binding MarR family transcriptional regulator
MSILKAFGTDRGHKKYYEEAIYSVTLLNNIINKNVSGQLSKYNLTLAKFNVLMVVQHLGGVKGIKQVTISKYLILTPSNITKLIDKLEKDKLIARSAPMGDRRVNIVTITEKGSKLVDIASAGSVNGFKKVTGGLSQDKLKRMSSLLVEWVGLFENG